MSSSQVLNQSALVGGFRENSRLGGKGSEQSYVPTTKKFSSPWFNNGYLVDSNKSPEKKLSGSKVN